MLLAMESAPEPPTTKQTAGLYSDKYGINIPAFVAQKTVPWMVGEVSLSGDSLRLRTPITEIIT